MHNSPCWTRANQDVELAREEVHVWRVFLDCEEPVVRRMLGTLSPDEQERARRFVFERDRTAFVVTRGALRDLFGKYLKCSPAEINFGYTTHGKPFLVRQESSVGSPIEFSVSHSHGMALLAFAVERRLGVDVELIRPDFVTDDIAQHYFSKEEVLELQSLPGSSRSEGFFLCWTRKEAYVKARGQGLQIPLQSFQVSLAPTCTPRLASSDSSLWKLVSLSPGNGYVGALVGEGKNWRLVLWDWDSIIGSCP